MMIEWSYMRWECSSRSLPVEPNGRCLLSRVNVARGISREAIVETVGPDAELAGDLVPGPVFGTFHVSMDGFLGSGCRGAFFRVELCILRTEGDLPARRRHNESQYTFNQCYCVTGSG